MESLPEDINRSPASQTDWDRMAATRQFQDPLTTKKVFILPPLLFILAYHFTLPVMVGLAPHFVSTKVIGGQSLAYLFALSLCFAAWLIVWRCFEAAGNANKRLKEIIEKAGNSQGDE